MGFKLGLFQLSAFSRLVRFLRIYALANGDPRVRPLSINVHEAVMGTTAMG